MVPDGWLICECLPVDSLINSNLGYIYVEYIYTNIHIYVTHMNKYISIYVRKYIRRLDETVRQYDKTIRLDETIRRDD